jgi:hypothetical protein
VREAKRMFLRARIDRKNILTGILTDDDLNRRLEESRISDDDEQENGIRLSYQRRSQHEINNAIAKNQYQRVGNKCYTTKQMVLLKQMRGSGQKFKDIGRLLKINHTSASKAYSRMMHEENCNVPLTKKLGRPRKMSDDFGEAIMFYRSSFGHDFSIADLTDFLNDW